MKKNLKSVIAYATAALLSVIPSAMQAQSPNGNGGDIIILDASKINDTELGNDPPKGPVQVPYVTLDDHTLYIWSQHNGFTLTLVDDNDTVVYQTYLFAGVQYDVLPATLSGTFTLILSDDTYMYTGTIGLE